MRNSTGHTSPAGAPGSEGGKAALDPRAVREEVVRALVDSSMLIVAGYCSEHTDEIRRVLDQAHVATFAPGETIVEQGAPSDGFYFIASGQVEVVRDGAALCTLSRLGDVFGEMGALTGDVRSATVRATQPTVCLQFGPAEAKRLTTEENLLFMHLLHQALTRVLSAQLDTARGEIQQLTSRLKAH